MKVELINYTKDADGTIAAAGKLCYSASDINKIRENLKKDEVDDYIQMLADLGHLGPLEHVSFTFAVEGVSRALTHQLVRHRIASYSQQSQRYVNMNNFKYVIPPEIANNEEALKLYKELMEKEANTYNKLTAILYSEHLNDLVLNNVPIKKAQNEAKKKAIEDARYVLPNACETKIIVTMNARSLLHFFSLRCCNRAQWEIRKLATEMLKQVKSIYPNIFNNAGPGCVIGACPEGKMTCGKTKEVRDFFQNL